MKYIKFYYIKFNRLICELHNEDNEWARNCERFLPIFCCNNSILGIESVKKEFIINLDTFIINSLLFI